MPPPGDEAPHLGTRLAALAGASHPLPTVAVTVMTTALVASAGNQPATCVIAACALLAGQLSIGWSNDALDADLDLRSGRSDKPAASGSIDSTTLWRAAIVAVVATVPLSLALGWRAGSVHLVGVSCGWLYNLVLKRGWLSPLPFFIAFGGLPAIATFADRPDWPPVWTMLASGLIGVAGHVANVLPDFDADRLTGISGLPHRIGRGWSAALGTTCGLGATALVIAVDDSAAQALLWTASIVAIGLAVVAALGVHLRPKSEIAFLAITAIAAVDVIIIVASRSLD